MKIQHLSYPFDHTIIYDYFKSFEAESIINECFDVHEKYQNLVSDTKHHENLLKFGNTKAYAIDSIYEKNREESKILTHTRKLFNTFDTEDLKNNIFLNYIKESNRDTICVQFYDNNSTYFRHIDVSVLTAVYIFWLEPPAGGEFLFTNYNYKPYILNNCCLIFPSIILHEVLPVKAKRISITHQLYIK